VRSLIRLIGYASRILGDVGPAQTESCSWPQVFFEQPEMRGQCGRGKLSVLTIRSIGNSTKTFLTLGSYRGIFQSLQKDKDTQDNCGQN